MKRLRSASDLAINGGPPAFAEPLHVGRPNLGNRDDFLRRVESILDRRWFSNNGPMVQELERRLAEYLGAKHCVTMCNGTVALEIAIRALGLAGEVIVPSFTFVATPHSLQWQGITPVFADVDPKTYTLDPRSVEQAITPRTSGIIGVHVWGIPCAIDELQQLADSKGLRLMFDAAHALGCSHNGRMIGSFGECEVLSFHATKFFNSFEGGAVVTNSDTLAEKLRLMRNFGFEGTDRVVSLGTNGKMSEISAAMGLTSLEAIGATITKNRENYESYKRELSDVSGLNLITYSSAERSNYQYVAVDVGEEFPLSRDELVRVLHAENVLARRYFYPGCHQMEPYRSSGVNVRVSLSYTEAICKRVVCFPSGTAVTEDDLSQIGQLLRFIAHSRAAPEATIGPASENERASSPAAPVEPST